MSAICDMFNCNEDELKDTATEMRSEEERRWIEILSNPLYISLEWLWRIIPIPRTRKEDVKKGMIEATLSDAYLLENRLA